MTKEKEFLTLFNDLEKYLRVEYQHGAYSYTGFVSKLYQVKKYRENPIIDNKNNFDLIHQAAQMRNIIAHNNDILVPSDKFISEFKKIVGKLCEPIKISQIMTKFTELKIAKPTDKIGEVIELLKTHGYNTIPVIENEKLLGAFTEKTVFDYLTIYKNKSVTKDMTLSDIMEAIDLDMIPRKYYEFIGRNADIYEAYEHYTKDKKRGRELLLIFVTEHGEQSEKLLGIVSFKDLENALID